MNIQKIFRAVINLFTAAKKSKVQSVSKEKQHKLIGKEAVVSEDINTKHGTGKVILGDSWWIATNQNSKEVIRKGDIVKVTAVKGYKLIVSRI